MIIFNIKTTVKPDLTTTCEQRPPVNNGQFESLTASLNLSFIRNLCQTAAFFRSKGWPLNTGLIVVFNGQFESSTASQNLSFIRHLCLTAAFFRSQGWPLYTGLTVSRKSRFVSKVSIYLDSLDKNLDTAKSRLKSLDFKNLDRDKMKVDLDRPSRKSRRFSKVSLDAKDVLDLDLDLSRRRDHQA